MALLLQGLVWSKDETPSQPTRWTAFRVVEKALSGTGQVGFSDDPLASRPFAAPRCRMSMPQVRSTRKAKKALEPARTSVVVSTLLAAPAAAGTGRPSMDQAVNDAFSPNAAEVVGGLRPPWARASLFQAGTVRLSTDGSTWRVQQQPGGRSVWKLVSHTEDSGRSMDGQVV